MTRPVRIQITNELGNRQTLPSDRSQFEVIPGGEGVIFLGLGPEPELLRNHFPDVREARYVECPTMTGQIRNFEARVPVDYTPLPPEEFTPELARQSTVLRYRPGLKAFPSFWAPLAARTAACRLPKTAPSRVVWLPSGEGDLLGKELTLAFEEKGYQVRTLDPETLERSPGTELPALLSRERPALFFSINFKGLEPFGLAFHLLREAGVEVAVWLVDNPFHILTSVKTGAWKEARLFVTDHSFIAPLIRAGARRVTHLPLAASPPLFATGGSLPEHARDLGGRLVFVGRSEFPKKSKFFAGLTPNPRILEEAVTMLEKGERPHFHWWQEHIRATLWPGNEIRHVGVGAEVAGYAWKVRCLAAAGPEAVIFGDEKWGQISEITAETRSPLDYYAALPAVYRAAAATLNVTGMQLPAGLTQRHFDVWCAGGFLLTDANPGLQIFPEALVEQIMFKTPADILPLFSRFREETPEKTELREAWRKHILSDHTYANRIDTVLTAAGLE
ncbi:glycosyltransferase [Pseudodesulfovibrio cashew]|uniref:Glycosyltransferase n=1 Tax=Pseudodesulfovibrio cashew TaxID=2678688 RepID=A0A6I6JCP1_9BACT|nr:DUF3880 domain-containing protein [Pseudodesulfovibrio cashew]QGY40566.1 glycosyltransferase [Pseudodesulfovibrio cashew]